MALTANSSSPLSSQSSRITTLAPRGSRICQGHRDGQVNADFDAIEVRCEPHGKPDRCRTRQLACACAHPR